MFTLHRVSATAFQVRLHGEAVFVGPQDDCLDFLAVVAPPEGDAAPVYSINNPPESSHRGRYLNLP